MLDPFDSPYVDENKVFAEAKQILNIFGEGETLEYLAEIASNVFSCPDKCDNWAVDYFNNHLEDED